MCGSSNASLCLSLWSVSITSFSGVIFYGMAALQRSVHHGVSHLEGGRFVHKLYNFGNEKDNAGKKAHRCYCSTKMFSLIRAHHERGRCIIHTQEFLANK
jgi:hypothetical protein